MHSLKNANPTSPNTQDSPKSVPSRWRVWIMASRLPTLPAAISPVLVGSAAAIASGKFHAGAFGAALIAALLIQIGTNLANDLFDFQKGADTQDRLGPVRVTQAGLIPPRQVAQGMWVCFGLAFLLTLYLIYLGGWPILVIFIGSVAAGILYTGGPWPLGYNGLGDVFAFVFFGVVAVTGTYYLHTGTFDPFSLLLSLPIGLLVTNILVINNLRDIETDRAAGKRTLAVRFGAPAARVQYTVSLLLAYLVPFLLWLAGWIGPFFWLIVLSLPWAVQLMRRVLAGAAGKSLNPVLKASGQLELLFAVLLSIGLML